MNEECDKAVLFVKHVSRHFEKEHPDWKVCCKICGKDIDEIYEDEKTDEGLTLSDWLPILVFIVVLLCMSYGLWYLIMFYKGWF